MESLKKLYKKFGNFYFLDQFFMRIVVLMEFSINCVTLDKKKFQQNFKPLLIKIFQRNFVRNFIKKNEFL